MKDDGGRLGRDALRLASGRAEVPSLSLPRLVRPPGTLRCLVLPCFCRLKWGARPRYLLPVGGPLKRKRYLHPP